MPRRPLRPKFTVSRETAIRARWALAPPRSPGPTYRVKSPCDGCAECSYEVRRRCRKEKTHD